MSHAQRMLERLSPKGKENTIGALKCLVYDNRDWASETDLTEVLGGTSGRGAQSFRLRLRALTDLGLLQSKHGPGKSRATYYKVTEDAKAYIESLPDWEEYKKSEDEWRQKVAENEAKWKVKYGG